MARFLKAVLGALFVVLVAIPGQALENEEIIKWVTEYLHVPMPATSPDVLILPQQELVAKFFEGEGGIRRYMMKWQSKGLTQHEAETMANTIRHRLYGFYDGDIYAMKELEQYYSRCYLESIIAHEYTHFLQDRVSEEEAEEVEQAFRERFCRGWK